MTAAVPCRTDSEFLLDSWRGISLHEARLDKGACEPCTFPESGKPEGGKFPDSDESFFGLFDVTAAALSILRLAAEMIPDTMSFALTLSLLKLFAGIFRDSSNFCKFVKSNDCASI